MVQYYPAETKKILTIENEAEVDESGYNDPGREVVDRNRKERLTRISEDTKEELDKVLRRVDNVGQMFSNSCKHPSIREISLVDDE